MYRCVYHPAIVRILISCSVLAAGCSPQAQKARHLSRAEKYLEKQKQQEAVIEYMNVLRMDPTNQVAIRKSGLTLFDMGELRASYPYLQRAAAADPGDMETGWRLGSVQLSMGDRVQARKKAAEILKRNPDHFEAIMLWAGTASSSNEIDEAATSLKAASARLPQHPKLKLALGSLHVQRKDLVAAEEVYRAASKQDPKAWEPHLALGDLYLLKHDAIRAEQEYKLAAELSPVQSLARLRFARFQWVSRKPKEAKAILENVTKESPEFLPAWLQLAQFAFAERDFDTCNSILTRILKRAPAHIDAFLLQQRVRLAQGKTDEAIAECERLVAAFPKAVQGRFFLGLAHLQKGDVKKATAELQKAVELNPDYTEAVRILSEIQIRIGNADAALGLLNDLIRRHPEAGSAYILMGSAYISKRDFTKAEETYRKVMHLMPENPQGPYLLGLAMRRQGKDAESSAMFEAALKLAPGFIEPLDQLAAIEVGRTGKWEGALSRIRKQIEIAPDQAGLHYLLGLACFRKADWDQAEQSLIKALELQPGMTAAYLVLSQVYVATHKDDQALARIEKALSVSSNDVASLMMKGGILERRNDVANAVKQYQRVLDLNPRYYQAANNLACLYANDPNMKEKAFELAKRARELAPKDPYVADSLGWIVYRRGDYKWALALLQESADRLPTQPEVLYHLGLCQCALGNEQAARDALTAALETAQDFVGKDQSVDLLALLNLDVAVPDSAARGRVEAFLSKYPDSTLGWVRLGALHEKGGDYAAAQKAFERAIALNPQFIPGLLRLVELHSTHLRDFDKALLLAKQARDVASADPYVADALAWLMVLNRGDHKWAHSLLADSARELPDDPKIQYHFAVANYVMGRVDVATALLRKVVASSTGFLEAKDAERLLKAVNSPSQERGLVADVGAEGTLSPALIPVVFSDATIAFQKGDQAKAQKEYQRILFHYPQFVPAIRELALLYGTRKETSDEEFKLITKARELLPQDPTIAVALGKVAFRRGQFTYACRLLQENAEKVSGKAEAFYYLGMCQQQLRDRDSARKSFRRVIELDPKSEWSEMANGVLPKLK
jgi:tetratricopeptide (TPR) repeat protein